MITDHQQTQKAKELLEVIKRKNFIRPLFEKNIVLFLLVIRFVGWLTVCFHNYQYLKNTAEHTSDLVSRFPELSTSTHFLKFTVKCVFAVQLGTSQGSEGSPGSKDHRQGAGEVPGRPPNVCGQKG